MFLSPWITRNIIGVGEIIVHAIDGIDSYQTVSIAYEGLFNDSFTLFELLKGHFE